MRLVKVEKSCKFCGKFSLMRPDQMFCGAICRVANHREEREREEIRLAWENEKLKELLDSHGIPYEELEAKDAR